jgi:hypothetical protein
VLDLNIAKHLPWADKQHFLVFLCLPFVPRTNKAKLTCNGDIDRISFAVLLIDYLHTTEVYVLPIEAELGQGVKCQCIEHSMGS